MGSGPSSLGLRSFADSLCSMSLPRSSSRRCPGRRAARGRAARRPGHLLELERGSDMEHSESAKERRPSELGPEPIVTERNRYYTGKYLVARDFQGEQE